VDCDVYVDEQFGWIRCGKSLTSWGHNWLLKQDCAMWNQQVSVFAAERSLELGFWLKSCIALNSKKAKHVAYFVCVSIIFNMHSCMYIVCSCLFTTNCPALYHAWWLLSLSLCTPVRHVWGGGCNYSSTHSHLKININLIPIRVIFWYLASNCKLFLESWHFDLRLADCQGWNFALMPISWHMTIVCLLGKWPTWCTILYYVFILTLYKFRAHCAHHQERQTVSIQPLVSVLPTRTWHGHRYRVTDTRGCIDTGCLSWWWAQCARNM
jgi:hypothetical protein